jgi:hypothetical protein
VNKVMKNLGSIKSREFLDKLSNHQLLKHYHYFFMYLLIYFVHQAVFRNLSSTRTICASYKHGVVNERYRYGQTNWRVGEVGILGN